MAYTVIDDPSVYFQTKIYTDGDATTDDTTSQTFNGNSDLQPDLMWFKSRNVTGNHGWMDTSRGKEGGTSFRTLFINGLAERTSSSGYDLTSMNSDGFSYGRPNQLDWAHDTPAQNVVWAWKINGGTTTSVSASGSGATQVLASTHQANTTAGISIITYTGTGATATITHGLGGVPDVLLFKERSTDNNWYMYHSANTAAPETDYMTFDTTAATTDFNIWNDTAPTSTVCSLSNSGVHGDTETFVCYAFRSIQGYSKFGSYTGNGNVDGTFVYTGFSPAWVMVKRTDSGNNWHMHDNKRVPYNSNNKTLYANLTNTEGTEDFDMLSNGFKLRESGGGYNASGGTYIYMAFAESPLVTSKGVPTTAR